MATIEGATKNCIPIQEATRGYKRVPKSYAHMHKHILIPLQELYFSQLPNLYFSHSRLCFCFLESGDSAFLGSCCSSCSFVEVTKWMCLKFRFISKKQVVSVHQQVTVAQEKMPNFRSSFPVLVHV